jgi:hypothetical protein
VVEFISVFCSGAFFGAALCITLVQQPAALEVGASFASRLAPRTSGARLSGPSPDEEPQPPADGISDRDW